MKRRINKIKFALLLLLALLLTSAGNSFAFKDGDFQYWNTESISWKVSDDWGLKLEEELRLGDNASNLYYQHTDLGFTYYGLVKWLDLGLNYRYVREEKSSSWIDENRPHLNANFKWKWLDLSFSDRSRLEYRNREKLEDYWRYRNKFTIKWPFRINRFKIQPYLADEIFYDFDEKKLNRNRLYGGINLTLFKSLKADIFYLRQRSKKNDKWSDIDALGTKLTLLF